MANLGLKHGIYHVRFRFLGKEYKKSLGIRDRAHAEAARNLVELSLHRLRTGQIKLPPGVDPGDFIVSGGTLEAPPIPWAEPIPGSVALPSLRTLTREYGESVKNLLAPSYYESQMMHLRHFTLELGNLADSPCDQVSFRDLDHYLKARLALRHPSTVERERITLLQFFKWVVAHGYLEASPAAGLSPIKGGVDRPPFRTIAEIEKIIARGGLSPKETLDIWECVFLAPSEVAELLSLVQKNAQDELSFMLHALAAFTGMRRGEILRLRWIDVDLEEEVVFARSRKQSRRRTETVRRIALHPQLKQILVDWRRRRPKGQFVVCDARTLEPIEKHRANRLFWAPMRGTKWCLDAQRHWFRVGFHTYRHSFCSNLAAQGIDQRIIDAFAGHRTESMRRRYRHLFPQDLRAAIGTLQYRIGPVVVAPDQRPAPGPEPREVTS